jgi:hypothetical protein
MTLRQPSLLRGVLLAWLFLLCSAAHAQFNEFAGTVVRFASVQQGRALLGAVDEWMPLTSELQRASTPGRTPPVSVEEFRAFSEEAVLAWTEAQQLRWRQALEHELFHVVSRHAPALATRLYTTIGFESVAPLQWPAAWLLQRIANPDAPFDRHLMHTTFEGRPVALMPLLVARRADLKAGESFFSVMQVRLLEVTPGDATRPTLPVTSDGQPVWHTPEQVPDYLARLGGNTSYILHPEEAMADNFAFVVAGWPARNRELLAQIEAVLREPAR